MEGRVSKAGDRAVELIQSEEQKGERMLTLPLNTNVVEKFHYKSRLQAMLPLIL